MAEVIRTQVLVLGGGVGGYSAAFRAADLGKEVVLVERHPTLGGVCLNVGCIPSKALLHVAQVINEAADGDHIGLKFNRPEIDLEKVLGFKNQVVNKLTQGVAGMAKSRNVRVVRGDGKFIGSNQLQVSSDGDTTIE